jgi:hypothetical protein
MSTQPTSTVTREFYAVATDPSTGAPRKLGGPHPTREAAEREADRHIGAAGLSVTAIRILR